MSQRVCWKVKLFFLRYSLDRRSEWGLSRPLGAFLLPFITPSSLTWWAPPVVEKRWWRKSHTKLSPLQSRSSRFLAMIYESQSCKAFLLMAGGFVQVGNLSHCCVPWCHNLSYMTVLVVTLYALDFSIYTFYKLRKRKRKHRSYILKCKNLKL